ncbi:MULTISPECIES: restriction endonuclease subunit S [Aeromonas]|uniref:restriction endonuclease subunit S n=1 Tax=Aeromonas TaxID=642 RepID=UPI001FC8D26D|nr:MULTISPECIES: restriction endonuclease subunit S [Aeromonas]MDH0476839.1 restriction endonuclease subunit S [Aeromonas caviae]
MSSEWPATTLGGFVRLQRGHDLTASEQQPGPYPVMGSAGQNGSHNVAKAKGPGVVVGRSGASMGRVHYSESDYWPHNTCLYVTDFQGNNPRFAYYVLGSLDLAGYNSGSAQPSLNRNYIYGMPLKIPSRAQQDSIVEVLSALDDRIALLRETNATLEAIAQALFKSWFVDFDPIHARARGEAPAGLAPEVAALFPDSFEESELGMVPKGWKLMQFGEFIDRQSVGKKYDQKSALVEGCVPILDQGKSGVIGFHNDKPGVCASLDSPVVVFANHTCYMRLITFDFSAIQNVLPFTGKGVDSVWAFYATKDRVKFSEYKGHWPDFTIQKAVVPDQVLTSTFRNVVDPLIRSMRNNELQAQTLATLRDTLLPRLISGQLRLPEAEAVLQEAGI